MVCDRSHDCDENARPDYDQRDPEPELLPFSCKFDVGIDAFHYDLVPMLLFLSYQAPFVAKRLEEDSGGSWVKLFVPCQELRWWN